MKSISKVSLVIVLLVIGSITSLASAAYDDPWLPDWEVESGYTSQFWGLNSVDGNEPEQPLSPDIYSNNEYGTAEATWVNDEAGEYVTWTEIMMGGHPSWATGVYGGMANFAAFEINAAINTGDVAGPLLVFVQYDWYAYSGADVYALVDEATEITPEDYYDYQIGASGSGNPWVRSSQVFELADNPGSIDLHLYGSGFAAGIDSFSVTTVIGDASELVTVSMPGPKPIELYTSTSEPEDSNWDVWQQDQDEDIHEDAIYLGMFDGASGHTDYQPESTIDGFVDGVYTTMSMGPGGMMVSQSLGVSGTNPGEFPDDQRNTRAAALFNLTKVMDRSSNPEDINKCKFRWSIDYVMPWAGSTIYLQAPTTLYVDIYAADMQNYWSETIDGNDLHSTGIGELQDEFDPNSAGILYAEKTVDIRVDNGPWCEGIQPLTNWYIEQNGVQFYDVDVTEEVKELIIADPNKYADPNTAFIGFTISSSLDGESVYLSMDARDRLDQNPIPPTLEVYMEPAGGN